MFFRKSFCLLKLEALCEALSCLNLALEWTPFIRHLQEMSNFSIVQSRAVELREGNFYCNHLIDEAAEKYPSGGSSKK